MASNFMNYSIGNNSKKYTIEEVVQMEGCAELIDGELIITDKTTVTHQRAVRLIVRALEQFIEKNKGTCEVFFENIALYCNELCDNVDNLFLPDVMSVCERSGIKDDGVHVVPRFIAEITSDSTKKNDFNTKLDIYKKIGVDEYWIVDIQKKMVHIYLKEEDYVPIVLFHPDLVKVSVYQNLSIDLSTIF